MKNLTSNSAKAMFFITLLIFLGSFLPASCCKGQQTGSQPVKYRNTIYFETFGATGLGGSVNYKRTFQVSRKSAFAASGGAGIIFWSWNQEQELVIPLSVTFIQGTKHSFEGGIGFSYLVFENMLAPNIALGYRYQKDQCFIWAGIVILSFFERYDYGDYGRSRFDYDWTIPVPGIRIGKAF